MQAKLSVWNIVIAIEGVGATCVSLPVEWPSSSLQGCQVQVGMPSTVACVALLHNLPSVSGVKLLPELKTVAGS